MRQKFGLWGVFLALIAVLLWSVGEAQEVNISGNNPYMQEYVSQNEDNWNKSIIYVFYNNAQCDTCAQAIGMIYNLYEQNYSGQYSYFEINYADPWEHNFVEDYDLDSPLSIVLVRVNDGMARGYYKIDNPQFWVEDPSYFSQYITSQINNFFG